MAEVLKFGLSAAQTLSQFDSDTAKVRSLEFMTGMVAIYALKKAYEGKTWESGGSLGVAGTMWALHGHVIGHNLQATSVVLTSQCNRLEEYLDKKQAQLDDLTKKIDSLESLNTQLGGKVQDLEQLRVGGSQLLGEQRTELEGLRKEKEALSLQIGSLKELLTQLREQADSIRRAQEQFDGHMAREYQRLDEERAKLEKLQHGQKV